MATFLFCLPRYHTNSVPWMRLLKSAGHEVVVHTISRGATEDYSILHPLVLSESSLSSVLKRWRKDQGVNNRYGFPKLRQYWRLMKQAEPDVVIIRGASYWFSRCALIIAFLQRRRVVIYDQEDQVPTAFSTWARRAGFRLIGVPHVTARLPVRSDVRCVGAASPLPFGPPPGIRPDEAPVMAFFPPRLLMVAKYRIRKGHHTLLQALATLSSEFDFTITFCGEVTGPDDQTFVDSLLDYAAGKGIEERIQFRNNVPHSEMPELYRRHDIFILPSKNEPAAVSPIEAAWSGCAVLVSRDSGTRGYLPPGQEFDFDPDNVNDIARALRPALQSAVHLQVMRCKCLEYISSVASADMILDTFMLMLNRKLLQN